MNEGRRLQHAEAAPVNKAKKHGKDPHEIPMEHYFDISAGIRGSDGGHRAAVRHYRKIRPLLESARGTLKAAREGFRIAEEARARMADLLGCEPRNVFFGNSAMRTLIPPFLGLGEKGRWTLLLRSADFAAIGAIVKAREGLVSANVTRQNFGEGPEREGLRAFDDVARLGQFAARFNVALRTFISSTYRSGRSRVEKGMQYAIYCAHLHRETGGDGTDRARRLAEFIGSRGNPAPLIIVDASHSAGAVKFDAPALGDIVIMNSSKALGAEPTLGICYASDRTLKMMEEGLVNAGWPRIAFQFSPETGMGVRSGNEAAALEHWVSLPELASLRSVLRQLRIGEREAHLKKLRAYFNGVLQFFRVCGGVEWERAAVAPNFSAFDIDYSLYDHVKVGEPLPLLSREIAPYVISGELPRSATLGAEYLSAFPFNEFANTIRFRVSWGGEHSLEDMRGLCKAIADALGAARPAYASKFGTLDGLLSSAFGKDGAAKIREMGADETGLFMATAAAHPDEMVRMAALERLEDGKRLAYVAFNADYEDVSLAATARLGADGRALLALADGGGRASALARQMLEAPERADERSLLRTLDRGRGTPERFFIEPIGRADFHRLYK